MGPGLVWGDLRRAMRGLVAFGRYLRSQETICLAIGMFASASSEVAIGRPGRYLIRLANVSDQCWDVKLTLEISLMTPTGPAATPAASLTKSCTMPPRRTTEVECHSDWQTTVVFMLDHVASPPDEFWTGELNTHQRYVVSAMLRDRTGKPLDKLDIYQEVQG